MAKRTVVHEERFSLGAIDAAAVSTILIDQTKRQYWPFNEWEMRNGSAQNVSVRKNGTSTTDYPVEAGMGAVLSAEEGDSFHTLSVVNNGGAATVADTIILFLRKVIIKGD